MTKAGKGKRGRIILGIDPGLSATGFGVIAGYGARFRTQGFGIISSNPEDELPKRLLYISNELNKVIKKFQPESCALETLFFKGKGARSVILTAECRGVILSVLARNKIPVVEFTPATVKLAITGSGRASKSQLKYMVRRVLKVDGKLPEHSADALAVAYTHFIRSQCPLTAKG